MNFVPGMCPPLRFGAWTRRTLADKLCRHIEAMAIPVTLSIGLASIAAAQVLDFEHLYREADAALYQAKHRGRNRVVAHGWASNPSPAVN